MNFVVGHPRSGTRFVAALLNSGGDVAIHELLANLSREGISAPTEYYEGRRSARSIEQLLDLYANGPQHVRIDSNWKLTWILPVLLEKFPGARVVHLVRDPRDSVRSCVNLDYYGDLKDRPEFRGDEARNFWLSQMPAVRRADWSTFGQLERNCAFWSESQRLALDALDGLTRVRRFRLEDLVKDETAAGDLFAFLDVPLPPAEKLREAMKQRVNDRERLIRRLAEVRKEWPPFAEWPEPARRSLIELCGETARAVGYALFATS